MRVAMSELFATDCRLPWLVARFGAPQRMLSWSMNRPGFVVARTVAWLEVRDADLPIGVDPLALLRGRLADAGLADSVAMMTSRDLDRHRAAAAGEGAAAAAALATLGLGNGVGFGPDGRVGAAPGRHAAGTINILAAVSCPLDDTALIEAVAIVATARSAALLADGGRVAATGTDCIVVACPETGERGTYGGLHTPAGRCLAAATFAAIRAARAEWETEFAATRDA